MQTRVIVLCILVAGVEVLVAGARFVDSLRPRFRSTLAMSAHFDYLVIGGGSGGMASARRAAGYGAKVRTDVFRGALCEIRTR